MCIKSLNHPVCPKVEVPCSDVQMADKIVALIALIESLDLAMLKSDLNDAWFR